MKTDVLLNIAKSKRISVDEIAKKMKVSKMQAYRYLNNPKKLDVDQVGMIADLFKRNRASIFNLIDNAKLVKP